jgi:hypothetical protein
MSFSSKLYTTMRLSGAAYQLLMAGATLFFTVRAVIEWDKPRSNVRTFQSKKGANQRWLNQKPK